jgi:hypothetical protein
MNAGQIITRLENADRAWQKERATALLMRYFKWPFIVAAVLIVADILLHFRADLRFLLSAAFVLSLLAAVGALLHLALRAKNPLERVARLLESRSPELGSKLINMLHLREKFLSGDHASALTRTLANQAVDDAAAAVGHTPFLPLTKEPDIKRLSWHVAAPLIAFFTLAVIFLTPLLTTLPRFLDPFGDHPPYSLTRIRIEEPGGNQDTVLYGGSFMVKASWSGHDPKELMISSRDPQQPGAVTTAPMMPQEPGLFAQQLENVRTDLLLRAHTPGNWSTSQERRLVVVLTPQYEQATIAITPPDYTGLREKSAPFSFNGATALKGSQIKITLGSNRPLKEGRIHLTLASGKTQEIKMTPADPVNKPDEISGSFTAEASGRMIFDMKDVDGIPADDAKTSALTVTHDLPPVVSVSQPPRDGFLVQGYKMSGRVTASDDYGLKSVRVHVLRFDRPQKPVESTHLTKIMLNDTVELPLTEMFDPPLKAGDQISFFAEAVDSHPAPPHVTRSEIRHLTVITQDEYHDFLRMEHTIADLEKKYDDLFGRFRELLEQQRKLADEAADLDKKLAAKPDDKALQEQREKQKQEQAKLNEKLAKAAEAMEKFVSDAPLYDLEKDFADMLAQEAAKVRESIAQNEADMKQGAQQKMGETAKSHHERMAGAQEQAEQQIEKAIADAAEMQEMMDNFNRYQTLHEAQELLTQQSNAYREKPRLDDTDKLAMQSLGATEREIGDELRALREKLDSDATKYAEKFPKAAGSCRALAEAMSGLRMDHLAVNATEKMMKGDGAGGYDGADRLRTAMASLIGQCEGGKGESSSELDQKLSLSQCKNGSKTARQMLMSRKFGRGSAMSGQGAGFGGMMNGNEVGGSESVYGMESKLGRVKGGPGEGEAPPSKAEGAAPSVTSNTIHTGAGQVNREGDAQPAATVMEQYRQITDAYFDRITGKMKDRENKP